MNKGLHYRIPDPWKLVSFLGSDQPDVPEDAFLVLGALGLEALRSGHEDLIRQLGPEAIEGIAQLATAQDFITSCRELVDLGFVPRWDSSQSADGLVEELV